MRGASTPGARVQILTIPHLSSQRFSRPSVLPLEVAGEKAPGNRSDRGRVIGRHPGVGFHSPHQVCAPRQPQAPRLPSGPRPDSSRRGRRHPRGGVPLAPDFRWARGSPESVRSLGRIHRGSAGAGSPLLADSPETQDSLKYLPRRGEVSLPRETTSVEQGHRLGGSAR